MAKTDVIMWAVSFMILLLVGLSVAPSLTASSGTARIAVINSELSTIRQASILWVAQNSPTGDFTGITATGVSVQLPALVLSSGKFQSKANAGITYTLSAKTGDPTQLEISVEGLTAISGSEASLKISQTITATGVTDTTVGDGILAVDYKGW